MGGLAATPRRGDPFVAVVTFVISVLEDPLGTGNTDSGGLTRWGISQKAHPDVDVANLTKDEAIRIYHDEYWMPARCDLLPRALALQFFTAYINMKPQRAIKCLQLASRVRVDGLLGPVTIAAVQRFRSPADLRARFSAECVKFYVDLIRRIPFYEQYLSGWLWRVCRVADEAGAWGDE